LLLVGGAIFGLGCALAAIAPGCWIFAGTLVVIGAAALTFTDTTNSLIQLSTVVLAHLVMSVQRGVWVVVFMIS
jgi:hypothetical protein